jgi:hypothetical protein
MSHLKNAHNRKAHDAAGELVRLAVESGVTPREVRELLDTVQTHSYLAGLAEAHEKMSGLYGFEATHYPIKED